MAKVENKKTVAKKPTSPKAKDSKQNTKKSAPKKVVATKSTSVKSKPKKTVSKTPAPRNVTVVKTVEVPKIKEVIQIEEPQVNKTECRFCHENFDKGLTVCPFCRKRQKDKTGIVIIVILSFILLICIIANHFIEKYYEEQISENDYKYNCELVSYEQLVRIPKELKNRDVKVIGKVVSVDGSDFSYGNLMIVKMDANLFDGPTEQIVEFEYLDSDYEIGFLEGDIITIYGKYDSINGNIPFIKTKYIVFGT